MAKRFNTTGVCIPRKHYMVDISNKLEQIEKLIENEFYFVINRPRQYGKTTTLAELYKRLKNKYILIDISFESLGIGYLLIFKFNENKQYTQSQYSIEDKNIFEVVV